MKKSSLNLKKIIISGYYGFGNFGDEAILGILTEKLRKITPDIRVFSKSPKTTRALYKVQSTLFFCPFQVIFKIMKCDVLISGGGSLLQDVTSLKSLFYYLWVINTALFFRKKVIIFAQGIGPINNKFGAFLTKNTLKKCTLVTVRDEKSLFLLRGWGLNPDLVCDPLFDISLVGSMPSGRVGVQLRDFKTLKENLLIKLAEHINKNFADKEIEIYSFQDSIDFNVCKRFEAILKSINPAIKTTLIYNQTFKNILDRISKLDYMIAMRFHANLVALKYGIKTLAICYDEKVEKLAAEVQIPFVSMLANEDYDYFFTQLKNLDKRKLIEFSNSKHFDWTKIEEVIL
ncbi:MAG: polysaccharide pyruvyl transferase CsaB [Candidatus Gastranaerophilales bacterium]|nr:polysaccharide pyruvyl transferase CsaB [Candidatus Gastranaerophilales bacterium]